MSFFIRASKPVAAMSRVAGQTQLRAFTVSSSAAIKESNKDTPDLGAEYEKHKQDQIQKQKEGKGHWKPELASNSEEAIHADKSDKTMEQLQNQTKDRSESEKERNTGTSQSNPNL